MRSPLPPLILALLLVVFSTLFPTFSRADDSLQRIFDTNAGRTHVGFESLGHSDCAIFFDGHGLAFQFHGAEVAPVENYLPLEKFHFDLRRGGVLVARKHSLWEILFLGKSWGDGYELLFDKDDIFTAFIEKDSHGSVARCWLDTQLILQNR